MIRHDLESLLAADREMLVVIIESDADLSVEQGRLVERATRVVDGDRPLDPPTRAAVKSVFEQLHELTAGD